MQSAMDQASDVQFHATRIPTNLSTIYYPPKTTIPGHSVNVTSVPILLSIFFGTCMALCATIYKISKRLRPDLSGLDALTAVWFVLSGCIHMFFEGYFVINFIDLATHQTIIGQLWKEYSFSDSRYLTQDTFVVCMEAVTALVWGPGCLLVAALVVLRHPMRFPLQLLVSTGQFYGDVLYYATAAFEYMFKGVSYSRPEPLYFYCYFLFMNAIWLLVPGCLIYQSISRVASALTKMQDVESLEKTK